MPEKKLASRKILQKPNPPDVNGEREAFGTFYRFFMWLTVRIGATLATGPPLRKGGTEGIMPNMLKTPSNPPLSPGGALIAASPADVLRTIGSKVRLALVEQWHCRSLPRYRQRSSF